MANTAKDAILRAKIEGVLYDLMIKTTGEMVILSDGSTLNSKLADFIASLNAKATPADITEAVNALKQEILGTTPVEAYNTFTELAQYIEEHEDAYNALMAAIGDKADVTTVQQIQNTIQTLQTTLNGLGALANKSTVSESDLDSALKTKINDASAANHGHTNKSVLDGISAAKVALWDGKAKVYASGADVSSHAEGEIFVQLV